MGPVGRLWRRAPAWRLLLVSAAAFTALAAMFPPSMPAGLIRAPHAVPPDAHAGALASFRPPAPPGQAGDDAAAVAHPAPGLPRSGTIPFDGRQLPLPPGEWQVIEVGRSAGAMGAVNVQVETFAQIKGNSITGVLVALTPDAVSGGLPPPTFMQTCLAADQIAGQIAPPNPRNPLANECWVVAGAVLSVAKEAGPGTIHVPELDRFRDAGVSIPDRVAALDYRRSDQDGWWSVTLFTADASVNAPSERRRLQVWARNYAAALHRGFDSVSTAPARTAG